MARQTQQEEDELLYSEQIDDEDLGDITSDNCNIMVFRAQHKSTQHGRLAGAAHVQQLEFSVFTCAFHLSGHDVRMPSLLFAHI